MAQRNQNDEQGAVCEDRRLHTRVLESVPGWSIEFLVYE